MMIESNKEGKGSKLGVAAVYGSGTDTSPTTLGNTGTFYSSYHDMLAATLKLEGYTPDACDTKLEESGIVSPLWEGGKISRLSSKDRYAVWRARADYTEESDTSSYIA